MSALARYFKWKGATVSGYDKTPTVLTNALQQEGIAVHFTDDVSLIDKNADIVVYTPAIPNDHAEYNFLLNNGYLLLKRSEVLGLITRDCFTVCVAGTHGKTTTSAMIAHILRASNYGCNAFLGGISANYNTNFWSSTNSTCVAEADEYDRSFLQLHPDVAVITSMDADHLDIYGDESTMQDAFIEFSANIKKKGLLIRKSGIKRSNEFKGSNHITYSLNDSSADIFASDVRVKNGSYHFNLNYNGALLTEFILNMGGMHNVENAVAAVAVALYLKIDLPKIQSALSSFAGVKRRFEYILRSDKHILIDDYAHHPEELRVLINGARSLYPNKKLTIVFQPHLYSRTRDLADGFASALSLADKVWLLPIYPARETPIEGVSSDIILNKLSSAEKCLLTKEQFISAVENENPSLLIMSGAGDIDMLVDTVKAKLN